jgi:hypothetical protein
MISLLVRVVKIPNKHFYLLFSLEKEVSVDFAQVVHTATKLTDNVLFYRTMSVTHYAGAAWSKAGRINPWKEP